MNKTRRKKIENQINVIEAALSEIEDLKDEEQESFDNIPENLQMSDRAMDSEMALDAMNDAIESIEDGIASIRVGLDDLGGA